MLFILSLYGNLRYKREYLLFWSPAHGLLFFSKYSLSLKKKKNKNTFILLKYSCLTTFQVHSKVIQLYVYIYFKIIFYYVLVAQSCLTLHDLMDCTLQAPVHGILQARILEWVAISFSSSSLCYIVNLCFSKYFK